MHVDVKNDDLNHFAKVIKLSRTQNGYTQESLAEEIAVSVRTIKYIEAGKSNISPIVLFKLVRCLDIPTDSLFYPERKTDSSSGASDEELYLESLIHNLSKVNQKLLLTLAVAMKKTQ